MTNTAQSLSFYAPVPKGFAFEMRGPLKQERAREIVKERLGEGWSIRPFGDQGTDFEVLGPLGEISVDRAWELSYRFRTLPDVVYAEPLFALSMTRTGQEEGVLRVRDSLSGRLKEDSCLRLATFRRASPRTGAFGRCGWLRRGRGIGDSPAGLPWGYGRNTPTGRASALPSHHTSGKAGGL